MNPNSQHQLWSRWEFVVHPGGSKRPLYANVQHNAATFGRLRFGTSSQMNIVHSFNRETKKPEWFVHVRSEGHPVHDPQFVTWMTAQWTRWAEMGFGPGTRVECRQAKLEAGDRQDGSPRDQLVIMDARFLPNLRDELAKMREEQNS